MKTVKEIKAWIDTKESRDEATLKQLVGEIIDRDWKKFKYDVNSNFPTYTKTYSLRTILTDKLFRYLSKIKKQRPEIWRMETLYDNHIIMIELQTPIDCGGTNLQKYIIRITNNKRTTRKNTKKE